MGLISTTTRLTYARNDLIKQGRHHVLDKCADMIYYAAPILDKANTFTLANIFTLSTGAGVNFNGIQETLTVSGNCTGSVCGIRSKSETDGTARTIGNFFGANFDARLVNASDALSGIMAGLQVAVSTGASTTGSLWVYGINIDLTEAGGARATWIKAFINFQDYDYGGSFPCQHLFDVGGSASRCSTGTSGDIEYNQTLHILVNTADRYIPLSSEEGTYTTAYPIATTSTIISTCTTAGISCSASTLNAESGRIGKFVGSVANAAQGDGYGVFEMQANFSGTVPSGSVANAASFWINFSASTITAGTMICVQNNGIWAPAGLTLSTSNFVIGMRMHCEIVGGTQPQEIFCFSTNIVANHITSLWQINVIEDINTTSTKSGSSVAVPFLKTSAGTQYYVNAYTS